LLTNQGNCNGDHYCTGAHVLPSGEVLLMNRPKRGLPEPDHDDRDPSMFVIMHSHLVGTEKAEHRAVRHCLSDLGRERMKRTFQQKLGTISTGR
jgi:hypothetical protein